MKTNIQVIEKPEWVLWDEIKKCLSDAHTINRDNGINMSHYQWSAEKIKDYIGDKGIVLVALDGRKIVGTASFTEKNGGKWFAKGRYAYMCFAGVIPEYKGIGLYRILTTKREEIAQKKGYKLLVFDTHIQNKEVQTIAKRRGYKYVQYFQAASKDHFSVMMAKWLGKCPYSKIYCRMRYLVSMVEAHVFAALSRKA